MSASSIDKKRLEHEIKLLVDSVRVAHKLAPLYNDSILYVASDHHAKYLVKLGRLDHFEKGNKGYTNPQERALTYGAPKTYLVGENIAYTPFNSSVQSKNRIFQTYSYKEIARCIVDGWIHSKGHYKNMISPDYQITGLSIGIDAEKQRIYACQKFAKVVMKFDFEENKRFFPYSGMNDLPPPIFYDTSALKYPYHLKRNNWEECEECRDAWAEQPGITLAIERNQFVLRCADASFIKELLQNQKDGFAVEIVSFDPFACDNAAYENEPSRRNGKKRSSGEILQPIYRKDLIKGFKKKKKIPAVKFVKHLFTQDSSDFFSRMRNYNYLTFDAQYFEYKLGRVPKNTPLWWNHNLLYIHNKRICQVTYFTQYPGEVVPVLLDVDYFPPKIVNDYEFKLEHFADTFSFYYEPGKTLASVPSFETYKDFLKKNHITITDLEIVGYSSVDGTKKENDRLQQARAQNILTTLQPMFGKNTAYQISSSDTWAHFYTSVAKEKKWAFLSNMSQEEVQAYLLDPKNPQPDSILNEERKVFVRVLSTRFLSPQTANYYVNRDIQALILEEKTQNGIRYFCSDMDKLSKLYQKAYYFTQVDTLTTTNFLAIDLKKYQLALPHSLEELMAFYPYELYRQAGDSAQMKKQAAETERVFQWCGAAEHLTPEFHYLTACQLVDNLTNRPPKTSSDPNINKALDRMDLLLSSYDLDSVFHYNVAKANLNVIYCLIQTIDKSILYEYQDLIRRSLIQVYSYYKRNQLLTPEKVLELAKLFCFFNEVNLAEFICRDFLNNDAVLLFYLPIAYYHSSYLSPDFALEFEQKYWALMEEGRTRFTPEQWCQLFFSDNGIPFQILDQPEIRAKFCSTCPNRALDFINENLE